MNALELKQKNTKELLEIAEGHGLKHVSRQKKADIIFNNLFGWERVIRRWNPRNLT